MFVHNFLGKVTQHWAKPIKLLQRGDQQHWEDGGLFVLKTDVLEREEKPGVDYTLAAQVTWEAKGKMAWVQESKSLVDNKTPIQQPQQNPS